jgi:hypothetical protein
MKTKLILGLTLLFALVSANAYELNGDLNLKWTGFKTAQKVGVSGTFKNVEFKISKNDDFAEFLKSANVKIDTLSFDSGLDVRNKSIVSTLFSLKSSENILATISKVDMKNKTLTLKLTMNEVTKNVPMTYYINKGSIIAKGQIDILDYNMSDSFAKFAKACFDLHEGKSYSEVHIAFTLPFKK